MKLQIEPWAWPLAGVLLGYFMAGYPWTLGLGCLLAIGVGWLDARERASYTPRIACAGCGRFERYAELRCSTCRPSIK
jgi:hypothetical protein